MSRDAGEDRPPRRTKPAASRPPVAKPEGGAAEPNAWRPNSGNGAPSRRVPPKGDVPEAVLVPDAGSWWERLVFGRIGAGQLSVYCRQLAAYLDAGVDIFKALTSLERQFARTALGPVTQRLSQSVRRGDSLGEAFEREPRAFDSLFVSMMKVAEARGGVPETLRLLSRHYEARQNLIRQARTAMIYPIAVLIVASGVIALLTVWLLPMFLATLKDSAGPGAVLPLPSRILMGFSNFIQLLGWWLVPLMLVGIPFLLFRAYRTAPGKRVMDEVALRIPVIGTLLGKLDTTRFARALASLLGAGVAVGESLDLTAGVVALDPFRRALRAARARVLQGTELSVALGDSRCFGHDVLAILGSGEETGKLPESLEHVAREYEEQVAYMVKNMGQLIQPLLMVVLGGIVLFIILAVLLPYIALINSLSH
jgi:type IV pilus assembly protein PilC